MSDSLGEIVKVPANQISLDDMSDTIAANVAKTWTMVDNIFGQLDSSILNLKEVVGEYKSKLNKLDSAFKTIDKPQFPTKPNFAQLILDSSYPDGYIPDPTYKNLGNLDFALVAPTPPEERSSGFSWLPGTYNEGDWVAVASMVHNKILTGTYGLSEAAHSALVSMEQETRRRNQEREFRSGLDAVGAMGFNLPGGHISAFISDFQGEVLKRDQDALNNITAKSFDIANDREKFFIGTALDAQKMLRDFFDKVETRGLEAAKSAAEYLWRFFGENIKLFLGKYEGEKLRLEGLKVRVEAITAANKNETEKFVGRAQVLESRYRAISEKNRGLVDARKGEVETYSIEVAAIKDEYVALIEELRVNNDAVAKRIDREIAAENIDLTAFVERAKMLQAIGMGVSQIWSQGLASTIGALNWTMSNSYSGQESKGVSWTAHLGEAHSYEHDPES